MQVTSGLFGDHEAADAPAIEADAADAPASEAAPQVPKKPAPAQYEVCVEGHKQKFGLATPVNKYFGDKYPNAPKQQPDGIWIHSDGTCQCVHIYPLAMGCRPLTGLLRDRMSNFFGQGHASVARCTRF